MSMQQQIKLKIQQAFPQAHIEIENESHLHAGPATESHFKLAIVAEEFEAVSRVKRHQMVYKILSQEMTQIHALALHTFTPDEWLKQGKVLPKSPDCAGVNQ